MAERKKVFYRLEIDPRFKEEIRLAAEADDGKTMHRFIIDAVRNRITRINQAVQATQGNPASFRPEGIR